VSTIARSASPADLPFLEGLDTHIAADDLAALVAAGRVLVGDVDGAPVGFLRWGLFWDQVPFMYLLWVLPDWRGRGVGTTLVEASEKAQAAAAHEMVLTSTVSAETAQHFYRRLGYLDTGSLLLPDEPAELIFRKHLAH
jgi:ribosomal protein S18 acetylase RimI-like enzyme